MPAELTVEEARARLEAHVRTTRWGRRDLAAKLEIASFERSGAFDVVFQSFIERRGTEQTHEGYFGGAVDGPENGPAPAPWDIPMQMPKLFTVDLHQAVRVPHTDRIAPCHGCGATGRVTCSSCGGDGRVSCSSCGGSGSVTQWRTVTETDSQGNTSTRSESYSSTCSYCSGSGQVRCSTCGGDGRITCPTCSGACRLRHFVRMHVRWLTQSNSQPIEKTDLPDELVGLAGGDVILHEEEERIEQGAAGEGAGPYRGPAVRVNAEVAAAANKLIQMHRFEAGVKLHRQRLVVRAVPGYEARYRWGKETRAFWVYGTDQQVHAPKFPLSPWRVGGAVVGGLSVPGAIVAASLNAHSSPPPSIPPPPPSVVTAAPVYTPPPVAPAPPPAPTFQAAAGPPPKAPPGKTVVELRTDPPGIAAFLGTKKLGETPLFVTIASKAAGVCKAGKCAVGRCAGAGCEPVTQVVLQSSTGERTIELVPSEGPVVEIAYPYFPVNNQRSASPSDVKKE